MPRCRTWSWLKFWHIPDNRTRLTDIDPDLMALVDKADDLNVHIHLPQQKERKIVVQMEEDPKHSVMQQKFFYKVYRNLSFLRQDDTKFAIKVGIGAALYALPAFIPATRHFYSQWRGEWGLLSYMLVCSMTIGGSNTTGYSRLYGTCLAAILAIVAWEVANGNPYLLAIFGFFMAYWTAY